MQTVKISLDEHYQMVWEALLPKSLSDTGCQMLALLRRVSVIRFLSLKGDTGPRRRVENLFGVFLYKNSHRARVILSTYPFKSAHRLNIANQMK